MDNWSAAIKLKKKHACIVMVQMLETVACS